MFFVTLPSVYAASKAAVEQFTRTLAKELGDRSVTVNAIAPGATKDRYDAGDGAGNGTENDPVGTVSRIMGKQRRGFMSSASSNL